MRRKFVKEATKVNLTKKNVIVNFKFYRNLQLILIFLIVKGDVLSDILSLLLKMFLTFGTSHIVRNICRGIPSLQISWTHFFLLLFLENIH